MKKKRIVIIQGHPDINNHHYCHAIASAYAEGAVNNGHIIQIVEVANLSLPFKLNKQEFKSRALDPAIVNIQGAIQWADHIVIIYPLSLGTMPALLKHFFEQIFRPHFAFYKVKHKILPKKLLAGKSAHIFATMDMPAWFYRISYRSHSLECLERNILGFVGIGPIRHSLISQIETNKEKNRLIWLHKIHQFGEACG